MDRDLPTAVAVDRLLRELLDRHGKVNRHAFGVPVVGQSTAESKFFKGSACA